MLTVLLRFALLGSFVGGGVFLTVRNLLESWGSSSGGEIGVALLSVLPASILASFLSLPLGFIPAVVTGLCYWYALARYTKRNPKPLLRVALGGGIGLLASTLFGLPFSFSEAPGAYQPLVNLLSWACAGTLAAGFSALAISDAAYAITFGTREGSNGA